MLLASLQGPWGVTMFMTLVVTSETGISALVIAI